MPTLYPSIILNIPPRSSTGTISSILLLNYSEFPKVIEIYLTLSHLFLLKEMNSQIMHSTQTLYIKLILSSRKMPFLHSLLQYFMLQDSLELAKILIELGTPANARKNILRILKLIILNLVPYITDNEAKTPCQQLALGICYEPAFQIGLDMLYRLKKSDDLIAALLRVGDLYHTIEFLKKNKIVNFDAQKLVKASESPLSNVPVDVVLDFIKNGNKS